MQASRHSLRSSHAACCLPENLVGTPIRRAPKWRRGAADGNWMVLGALIAGSAREREMSSENDGAARMVELRFVVIFSKIAARVHTLHTTEMNLIRSQVLANLRAFGCFCWNQIHLLKYFLDPPSEDLRQINRDVFKLYPKTSWFYTKVFQELLTKPSEKVCNLVALHACLNLKSDKVSL